MRGCEGGEGGGVRGCVRECEGVCEGVCEGGARRGVGVWGRGEECEDVNVFKNI